MRIERLRPLPSPDELAVMYPAPHDHRIYGAGHMMRVEGTVALAQKHIPSDVQVADLSCGNGEIARRLAPLRTPILGDIAPGYPICGPIEETISDIDAVDVFVCSETIEHLDEPLHLLNEIRRHTHWLVLSTPIDCFEDTNGEHLWAWNRDFLDAYLQDNQWGYGWNVVDYVEIDTRPVGDGYVYGVWICS